MILVFTVDKQIITRRDNEKVVRDSVNYLHVNFSFSEEWTGDKTAVFKSKSGIAYNVLVGSDGSCLVPWEVLKEEYFEVSAFCGDLITANVVKVFTIPSGYEIGSQGRIPTPDIYAQIIARLSAIEAEIDPTAIQQVVDEYLSDKDYVTEQDVEQIIADYIEAHKDELKGEKGDTGATGPQGPQGIQGPKGDTGEGVAAGGTTGQVLVKSSDADYETEWRTVEGGNITVVKNTNLLSIPDGEYSQYGLSVKIKDNIITLDAHTGLSQQVYIKLTNGVELAQGSAPSSWRQETVSFLETGKTYGYRNFALGGIANRHGITGTCRNSSGTTILGHSKPLETLAENVAYIQLYIPKGAECENFQFGIEISADAIPADWEGTIIANKDYFKQYVAETALATEHFIDVDFSPLGLSSAYTQGMCSDGTYLYVATINSQDDTANTLVCKYALSDGSLIAQECSYSLGHCNSMTYNPNTGKIYCVALDNVGTIHTINTDLTYDSSFTLSLADVYSGYSGVGAISYNSTQDKYVCLLRGDRKGYAIFDANFNLLDIVWSKTFAFSYRSSTYGAIFADKDYIYQVIGLSPTAVAVYGWNGKYIGEMMLPSATDSIELEDMEIVGDYVYLNVSQTQGQSVYVIKLLAEYTRWGNLLKI